MTLSNIAMPLAVAGVLALSSAHAQQTPAPAQPDLNQRALQSKGMDYNRMIADMNAADARLEELAVRMKSAEGSDQKIEAMQDVVSDLVTNQVYMHHMARAMIHKMMPNK
jgi:oligoribonuclease NrnB/cAMP/cGMP phosphodiesterase (DHH superfamily)